MAKFAPVVDRAGLEFEAVEIKKVEQVRVAKQHDNKASISKVNAMEARDRTEKAEKALDAVLVPEPPIPTSPLGVERSALLSVIREQQNEIKALKLEVLDLRQARDSWRLVAEGERKMVINLQSQFKMAHSKRNWLCFKVGSVSFGVGTAIGVLGGALLTR